MTDYPDKDPYNELIMNIYKIKDMIDTFTDNYKALSDVLEKVIIENQLQTRSILELHERLTRLEKK